MYLSPSPPLAICLSPSRYVSLFFYLSISLSLSFSLPLPLSLSLCRCLSVSMCPYLSSALSPSICLGIGLSASLSPSPPSLARPLSPSPSLTMSGDVRYIAEEGGKKYQVKGSVALATEQNKGMVTALGRVSGRPDTVEVLRDNCCSTMVIRP